MKFSLNTKPLKDAMNLCIINSNISKFFEKSTVVQLTASGDALRLNTQATSLISEATLKGSSEGSGECTAIVDCVLLKQLMGTIDSNEVSFDFQDNVLVVESGRSKFNVPKLLMDEDEVSLSRPAGEAEVSKSFCGELNPDEWKHVQDHQIYAVSISQIQPVYTYAWMDPKKGVLTGDPRMGTFTYVPGDLLSRTRLVSTTVVNLLSALDAGSKMYEVNDSEYVVSMHCDAFDFRSEFSVKLEDENNVGTYDSDMIFDMIFDESQGGASVSKAKISANIKQALLFSTPSDPLISLKADESGLKLVNDNVNCRVSKENGSDDYETSFVVTDLDTVISHMDGDDLEIYPIIKDDEVFGIRVKSGDMIALLGGVDE